MEFGGDKAFCLPQCPAACVSGSGALSFEVDVGKWLVVSVVKW